MKPEAYEDELNKIRRHRREAAEMILNGLRAPWIGMTPWWTTTACHYSGHPTRRAGIPGPCCCGKRDEGDPRGDGGEKH